MSDHAGQGVNTRGDAASNGRTKGVEHVAFARRDRRLWQCAIRSLNDMFGQCLRGIYRHRVPLSWVSFGLRLSPS